jgi:AraC family transcriptional regulator, regulatory protein of adaptative response / methylated-DNA-[protein]-cysteine methyltransferase
VTKSEKTALARIAKLERMNALPPLLYQFADLVLLHPEWEPGVLAHEIGASSQTLSRLCNKLFGITPKNWLLSYRMRAWRIALQNQTDVLDSALEHFGALSSAYRHAAHALGMSPASIRRGGAGAWLAFGCQQSPWGNLVIAQSDKGISWVCVQGNPQTFAQELAETYPNAVRVRMDARFAGWASQLCQRWPALLHAKSLPEDMLLAVLQHHLLDFVLHEPITFSAAVPFATANKANHDYSLARNATAPS